MRKEEKDIFDDLFRSKLYDFEAETTHDDWESIASRLPAPKAVPLRRRWPYWAAAAVVSLFVISTGIYFYQKQPVTDNQIAKQIEQETRELESSLQEAPVMVATAKQPVAATASTASTVSVPSVAEMDIISVEEEDIQWTLTPVAVMPRKETDELLPGQLFTSEENVIVKEKEKKATPRKWSFGAGAGGFTESAGNVINTYALRSNSQQEDLKLLALNAVDGGAPKTNIKHKTPVSFGVSASRQLNNRFSLQTGLTYTMLTSDWETQAEIYNNKTRQRLHFIGIPLSVSYKIAEWNRFNLYASAGGQTEVNVAGKERVRSYFTNQQTNEREFISAASKNVRMKEWQWSVNARVGVSYPIVRYVSAFAEVGAVYYFDNGSKMETIYSDKDFNINPQFGIRFGF